MKTLVLLATLALSTSAIAGTKINCDGPATDYEYSNCERAGPGGPQDDGAVSGNPDPDKVK